MKELSRDLRIVMLHLCSDLLVYSSAQLDTQVAQAGGTGVDSISHQVCMGSNSAIPHTHPLLRYPAIELL